MIDIIARKKRAKIKEDEKKGAAVGSDAAMRGQYQEIITLEGLSQLQTYDGLEAFDLQEMIAKSGIEKNDDIVSAKWIYGGMRLTPESLLKIISNGMKISPHYRNSAFMTRLELAFSKAISPEKRSGNEVPSENYLYVIFQVDLEEMQE